MIGHTQHLPLVSGQIVDRLIVHGVAHRERHVGDELLLAVDLDGHDLQRRRVGVEGQQQEIPVDLRLEDCWLPRGYLALGRRLGPIGLKHSPQVHPAVEVIVSHLKARFLSEQFADIHARRRGIAELARRDASHVPTVDHQGNATLHGMIRATELHHKIASLDGELGRGELACLVLSLVGRRLGCLLSFSAWRSRAERVSLHLPVGRQRVALEIGDDNIVRRP